MERIEILAFDGFDELDVIAPYEILASAGFDVDLVTVDVPAGPCSSVRGAHGISVQSSRILAPVPEMLIVPGGGWVANATVGARAEVQRGVIPAAIAERHAAGSRVAGVCTGALLLAASGILRGRPAVTHHWALDDLREYGADVRQEARVVDDGDVLTSGGVTSGIDLALHIIGREHGPDAAATAAERIEHDLRGPVLQTQR